MPTSGNNSNEHSFDASSCADPESCLSLTCSPWLPFIPFFYCRSRATVVGAHFPMLELFNQTFEPFFRARGFCLQLME